MPSNKVTEEIRRQTNKQEAGAVEAVDISVAENGFTVRVRRSHKPTTKSDGPCDVSYSSPKEHVFNDVEKLLTYVQDILS